MARAVRRAATSGARDHGSYGYVRHPQYVGFILVMFGFLVQWPTVLTLAMFPVLSVMYVKLARAEEREAQPNSRGAVTASLVGGDSRRTWRQVPPQVHP